MTDRKLLKMHSDRDIDGLYETSVALLDDARRYRWLKENHLQLGPDCWIRTGDDLDEAIDAAFVESQGE